MVESVKIAPTKTHPSPKFNVNLHPRKPTWNSKIHPLNLKEAHDFQLVCRQGWDREVEVKNVSHSIESMSILQIFRCKGFILQIHMILEG